MMLAGAVGLAFAAFLAIAFARPRARPQTTEDTWWRVVALHMEQATPKRRE